MQTGWSIISLRRRVRLPWRSSPGESGLDTAVVADSLDRLDRYLLIDRTGGKIRALSVGEALVKCHTKNDGTLPYVIENGVIKARKN